MRPRRAIAFVFVCSAVLFFALGRISSSWVILPAVSGNISPKTPIVQTPVVPVLAPRVDIGSITIPVEIRRTSAELAKGLSGRPSLDADKGMLFIFSFPSIYRFWMPDMNFPIDIIWINKGKVVDISANVSNEFDPKKPKFYTSSGPAQYVLEVNAGFAAQKGITIGKTVVFKDISL